MLADGHDRIRTALGLHPQIAHERIGELGLFDSLIDETRYVGEVGLDGGRDHKPYWKQQIYVFDHVLATCTKAGGKIITIHSRGAATEVLNTLEKYPNAGVPILHWFTGTKSELLRAIDMDCWFSVGPAMLNSKRGREAVELMPPERVLTETDGPFASIEGIPLMPGEVKVAYEALSDIWRMSSEDAARFILRSFRTLVTQP